MHQLDQPGHPGRPHRKIRVLAADDSIVMRGVLRMLFASGDRYGETDLPEMELCGVARDGLECLEEVRRLRPDVLLLDLEMPRMHGLEVLARLRIEQPSLPAIMCSAYTEQGSRSTMDALAEGAAACIMKPSMQEDAAAAMAALACLLLPKIAALAAWSLRQENERHENESQENERQTIDGDPPSRDAVEPRPAGIVAIGVSTGGPLALEQMLPQLPSDFPVPVLIVQHMPRLFTSALAERLNRRCALRVEQAWEGATIKSGTVWIAPGDSRMEVATAPNGEETILRLDSGSSSQTEKPAVDFLFTSVARLYGSSGLALVMTGMGSDGLAGSRAVHAAGGQVLVQDAATSTVWGMPRRVAEAGIAAAMLPLHLLAKELIRRTSIRRKEQTRGLL